MDKVIIEGGLLIERFIVKPEKKEPPDEDVVEIRIEDIKSDEDDDTDDRESTLLDTEKEPGEFEEQEEEEETDSELDYEIVATWEETQDSDVDLKTPPENLILNYENNCTESQISNETSIQKENENSSQGLLFSLLNRKPFNAVNQWSNPSSSNNQPKIEKISKNLELKEENDIIAEQSKQSSLLFKLLTAKKEDLNNVKTHYRNNALITNINEINSNSNSTSSNSSSMLFSLLSNGRNSSMSSNLLQESERTLVKQTNIDSITIASSFDGISNITKPNMEKQRRAFLNTSIAVPDQVGFGQKGPPEHARISNQETQKVNVLQRKENVELQSNQINTPDNCLKPTNIKDISCESIANRIKIIVHENKQILSGLSNKIITKKRKNLRDNSKASEIGGPGNPSENRLVHVVGNKDTTTDILIIDSDEETQTTREKNNFFGQSSFSTVRNFGKQDNDVFYQENYHKQLTGSSMTQGENKIGNSTNNKSRYLLRNTSTNNGVPAPVISTKGLKSLVMVPNSTLSNTNQVKERRDDKREKDLWKKQLNNMKEQEKSLNRNKQSILIESSDDDNYDDYDNDEDYVPRRKRRKRKCTSKSRTIDNYFKGTSNQVQNKKDVELDSGDKQSNNKAVWPSFLEREINVSRPALKKSITTQPETNLTNNINKEIKNRSLPCLVPIKSNEIRGTNQKICLSESPFSKEKIDLQKNRIEECQNNRKNISSKKMCISEEENLLDCSRNDKNPCETEIISVNQESDTEKIHADDIFSNIQGNDKISNDKQQDSNGEGEIDTICKNKVNETCDLLESGEIIDRITKDLDSMQKREVNKPNTGDEQRKQQNVLEEDRVIVSLPQPAVDNSNTSNDEISNDELDANEEGETDITAICKNKVNEPCDVLESGEIIDIIAEDLDSMQKREDNKPNTGDEQRKEKNVLEEDRVIVSLPQPAVDNSNTSNDEISNDELDANEEGETDITTICKNKVNETCDLLESEELIDRIQEDLDSMQIKEPNKPNTGDEQRKEKNVLEEDRAIVSLPQPAVDNSNTTNDEISNDEVDANEEGETDITTICKNKVNETCDVLESGEIIDIIAEDLDSMQKREDNKPNTGDEQRKEKNVLEEDRVIVSLPQPAVDNSNTSNDEISNDELDANEEEETDITTICKNKVNEPCVLLESGEIIDIIAEDLDSMQKREVNKPNTGDEQRKEKNVLEEDRVIVSLPQPAVDNSNTSNDEISNDELDANEEGETDITTICKNKMNETCDLLESEEIIDRIQEDLDSMQKKEPNKPNTEDEQRKEKNVLEEDRAIVSLPQPAVDNSNTTNDEISNDEVDANEEGETDITTICKNKVNETCDVLESGEIIDIIAEDLDSMQNREVNKPNTGDEQRKEKNVLEEDRAIVSLPQPAVDNSNTPDNCLKTKNTMDTSCKGISNRVKIIVHENKQISLGLNNRIITKMGENLRENSTASEKGGLGNSSENSLVQAVSNKDTTTDILILDSDEETQTTRTKNNFLRQSSSSTEKNLGRQDKDVLHQENYHQQLTESNRKQGENKIDNTNTNSGYLLGNTSLNKAILAPVLSTKGLLYLLMVPNSTLSNTNRVEERKDDQRKENLWKKQLNYMKEKEKSLKRNKQTILIESSDDDDDDDYDNDEDYVPQRKRRKRTCTSKSRTIENYFKGTSIQVQNKKDVNLDSGDQQSNNKPNIGDEQRKQKNVLEEDRAIVNLQQPAVDNSNSNFQDDGPCNKLGKINQIQERRLERRLSENDRGGETRETEHLPGRNQNDVIISCSDSDDDVGKTNERGEKSGLDNLTEHDKIMINQTKRPDVSMKECTTSSKTGKKKRIKPTKKCPHCQRVFSESYLKYHIMSIHTAENDKEYLRCESCDFKTLVKSKFEMHVIAKHTNPESMMDKMKKCDQCPKMFKFKADLNRHMAIHQQDRTKYCADCDFKTVSKRALKLHIQEHKFPGKEYVCSLCDFRTTSKIIADRHKYRIHSKQYYQCHKCHYGTKFKLHFNLHLINHKEVLDDQDYKYRCDKCDYKTYRPYSFQVHKLIHLRSHEVQYFYCYHCKFKARRKDNLKVHVLKHIKKPDTFQCFICDFTTTKQNILIRHIDKHARDSEKPIIM